MSSTHSTSPVASEFSVAALATAATPWTRLIRPSGPATIGARPHSKVSAAPDSCSATSVPMYQEPIGSIAAFWVPNCDW